MQEIFRKIYENNTWAGRESRSGTGSDLIETVSIRESLPKLIARLGIKRLLDIPCGDFNWLSQTDWGDLQEYHGCDIVEQIIEDNRKKFPTVKFSVTDITTDKLPDSDAILTRDCLGHLSNESVDKAIKNIERSRTVFFVATHWPNAPFTDIREGFWRPINMENHLTDRFYLVELLEEDIKGKFLGVWRLGS